MTQPPIEAFLEEIGYLLPEGPDFRSRPPIPTPRSPTVPGPQLVVPVMNARYALNAANARWGSLYDALYGTDALGDLPPAGGFDPAAARRVIAWARAFLDDRCAAGAGLAMPMSAATGSRAARWCRRCATPAQFVGYAAVPMRPRPSCWKTTGCIVISRSTPITHRPRRPRPCGRYPAGGGDVSIMDCEDSVAAVDAEDKTLAYANWLG
jgi:malate synthase